MNRYRKSLRITHVEPDDQKDAFYRLRPPGGGGGGKANNPPSPPSLPPSRPAPAPGFFPSRPGILTLNVCPSFNE